jgi:hypothetical protein
MFRVKLPQTLIVKAAPGSPGPAVSWMQLLQCPASHGGRRTPSLSLAFRLYVLFPNRLRLRLRVGFGLTVSLA